MPLSFYPGKTDEQLLAGIFLLDPAQLAHLDVEQRAELDAWFESPNVKAIKFEKERAYVLGMNYVLWVMFNLIICIIFIAVFNPVPLNGVDPMHFVGRWLALASIGGIIAPIKAKKWWVWAAFVLITTFTLAMSGIF